MSSHTSAWTPPQTRYARSGDAYIAYQVMGDGPVDVVLVSELLSHCEHRWEEPRLARSLRRLGSFSRVIQFDRRGTGLSDPVPVDRLPSSGSAWPLPVHGEERRRVRSSAVSLVRDGFVG